MGTMNYKGYAGSVDYSEEDNCLYGKVLGMSKDNITYEGKDVDELRKDFEGAVDDYLASCKASGVKPHKAYSGNLNVRLSPEIHSRIAMLAQQAGTTINGYIRQTLAKAVGITL
ncbi:MAG TPA: toxin-antitoxin system HicB family antitoxin [Prevotella sp.]|nr:toxin-antitoxin system HicB family antitoxin [Prevotella sp.]